MTFFLLLFAYLFSQFFRSFLAIVASDLTRDLGFGPAELGWIGSAWFIAFAIAQFPVGYLLDTVGPRRTMGGLMLVGVAGALIFALSPGFTTSVLGMALIGIGCSPMLMSSLYIFGRTERPERSRRSPRHAMVGLGNLGNLAAATPLALAAVTFGWRWSMAGVGLAMGLAALLIFLLLRDPPRLERTDGSKTTVIGDILAILRIPALWFTLPLHLVGYAMIATERGLWVGPFLDTVHGLDAIARGNAAFRHVDRHGARRALLRARDALVRRREDPDRHRQRRDGGLLLSLGLLPALGAGAATVLLVLVGYFGLTYSLMLSHGRQFIPDHLLGRGVTVLNFLAIGGAGLLQAVTGRWIDSALSAGTSPASAFATMHLWMGITLVVATLLFLRAPARPPQA